MLQYFYTQQLKLPPYPKALRWENICQDAIQIFKHYNRIGKHLKELKFNRPLSLLKAVTSRSSMNRGSQISILVQETTMMLRKCEPTLPWEENYSSSTTYGKDDVVRTKLDKYLIKFLLATLMNFRVNNIKVSLSLWNILSSGNRMV